MSKVLLFYRGNVKIRRLSAPTCLAIFLPDPDGDGRGNCELPSLRLKSREQESQWSVAGGRSEASRTLLTARRRSSACWRVDSDVSVTHTPYTPHSTLYGSTSERPICSNGLQGLRVDIDQCQGCLPTTDLRRVVLGHRVVFCRWWDLQDDTWESSGSHSGQVTHPLEDTTLEEACRVKNDLKMSVNGLEDPPQWLRGWHAIETCWPALSACLMFEWLLVIGMMMERLSCSERNAR